MFLVIINVRQLKSTALEKVFFKKTLKSVYYEWCIIDTITQGIQNCVAS